jgi:hypothetical protein
MDNKKQDLDFDVNKSFSQDINNNSENNIDFGNKKKTKDKSFKKINFGLWFLENRKKFFIGVIIFLLIVSAVLYSVFFYNLYDYIRYTPEERQALQELSEVNVNLNPGRLAIDLEIDKPQFFFHNNKYDFVVKVKNPNDNFFSYINYCFSDDDKDLFCSSATLFPGEDKYIIDLAIDLENRPNNLKFDITKKNWERVSVRTYPDWEKYYSERMNFSISDIKFEMTKPVDLGLKSTNNLSFKIFNNSPYNFWEVPLDIIMFYRGNIVGVNKYNVSEFMSLESKNIDLSWSNSLNSVDNTEIIPNLNILQEENYIRYK